MTIYSMETQQARQQLKAIREDTEKWFDKIDKEISKAKGDICFCCNEKMDLDDAHLVNFDNEVTALICWKCYERNYLDSLIITERGEDD